MKKNVTFVQLYYNIYPLLHHLKYAKNKETS